MLTQSRDIHLPEIGGEGYIAGRGIFPNGPILNGLNISGGNKMPGLLGKEWEVDQLGATALYQVLYQLTTTVQALYPMRIQLVQTKSGSTATPTVGRLAYWATTADKEAYIATPDPPAANSPLVAGVYLYTADAGDYVYIATGGEVLATCLGTVTNASAVGEPVFAASEGSPATGKVDGQAGATAITTALLQRVIGKFMAAAANGATVKICLDLWGLRQI